MKILFFSDKDYKCVYRNYDRAEYEPVFFVYSKKHHKWIEIKKLSTENAKSGRSPYFEVVPLPVGRNFSFLREADYAELPLRTCGSITG